MTPAYELSDPIAALIASGLWCERCSCPTVDDGVQPTGYPTICSICFDEVIENAMGDADPKDAIFR